MPQCATPSCADTRKITLVYYMNPRWRPELGGHFRVYNRQLDSASGRDSDLSADHTDVEPLANRLLCFWSDRLVHSVLASFAPNGPADHRYALTVWLTCDSPEFIDRENSEIKRHFG